MAVTATVVPAAVGRTLYERARRLSGLTSSGFVAVGAGVLGWLTAYFVGGRGLFLLVYMGAIAVAASVVIARRKRSVVATRSSLPSRVREGQVIDVELQLESRRRIGMFTLEEKLAPQLGATVRVTVETVSPTEGWSHRYTLRPRLRGVYDVGPLTATWTDPLGLAEAEQSLLPPAQLIVHPTVERVFDRPLTRELEDPPIRPPRTKPWPQGFEFYGMRDYVAGDDLRRVVWKAVARTGRMLVRESEQGITDRIVVIIDTDREWHQPGPVSESFEAAIRVAASVGTVHIKDGFTITLDCNKSVLAEGLRGPRASLPFLDELAKLQLQDETLSSGIERILNRPARRAHFVVITPHLDQKSAARVGLLVGSGSSVLVAAITWEESDPMTVQRASELGAQVVRVIPGASLAGIFSHSLGAGIR